MRFLKGWISPLVLVAIFASSITTVNAGIIVTDLSDGKTCVDTKVDWGIIVGSLTGIIVGNFTGIIVGSGINSPTQPCKA